MKKNFLIAILAVVFSMSFFPRTILAEDTPKIQPASASPAKADTVAADETEFSFGTVKTIGDNQLVVSEYDYESNADVDVTYQVAPDATFENVVSLKEIAVGDSVDIDYRTADGKKKAVAITVEKPLPEDEEATLETEKGAAKE